MTKSPRTKFHLIFLIISEKITFKLNALWRLLYKLFSIIQKNKNKKIEFFPIETKFFFFIGKIKKIFILLVFVLFIIILFLLDVE